jgi:hypothetical protein
VLKHLEVFQTGTPTVESLRLDLVLVPRKKEFFPELFELNVLLVTFCDNFLYAATDHFLVGFACITTGREATNLLLDLLTCFRVNTEVGAEVECRQATYTNRNTPNSGK